MEASEGNGFKIIIIIIIRQRHHYSYSEINTYRLMSGRGEIPLI